MSEINHTISNLWRVVRENPAGLVPFLAYACAITLIVALLTDALLLRRRARPAKPPLTRQPKPR
jgi:hypothetical protein